MRNVTDVLERLGTDARLRHGSREEIDALLRASGLSPALHASIVDGDEAGLERQIGATPNTCCMIEVVEIE